MEKTKESSLKKIVRFTGDVILNAVIIIGLVVIIRTYFFSPFQVYGSSMCDTLNYIEESCAKGKGEYLIINKSVYNNFFGFRYQLPKKGDIVVFLPPNEEHHDFFIKRVIGVEGDTIKFRNGEVYIYNEENPKGKKIEEPYLNKENKGKTFPSSNKYTSFTVPEGKFFVMGDNRNASNDSRRCFSARGCDKTKSAFLPLENIEGKAFISLWPLNKVRILK